MGESTDSLKRLLKASPGAESVTIVVEKTGEKIKTGGNLKVKLTNTLINNLNAAFGSENVVLK